MKTCSSCLHYQPTGDFEGFCVFMFPPWMITRSQEVRKYDSCDLHRWNEIEIEVVDE